ncbi:MAG TPA: xanthine dehydrogenase accessory protein XdhC [Bradyrhizobium sp.]|jgi:xanthine dehydrogenase accessory factor|uniref:xanthine dehydrogenase accessory protein XdhC n=1 Tax=Bradyrhizobium sp. TaxID=376 RepID=UPI002BE3770A|nr:xanthine dehydrogenase accessory protein XdhC [Bradyrhizobium sp.]HXB76743.1 xanthine dehydrogenase accessory protein XdhC [Bradyrhizobium sp.]
MQVWRRIQQSLEKQRRAALISVVKVEGSAPREVGARMVIQKDAGFFGTIGGGRLEFETLAVADHALSVETPSASLRVWPLGPNLGQCCGGSVTTLIETFDSVDLADIRELAAAEEAGPFLALSRMTKGGRVARKIVDRAPGGVGGAAFSAEQFVERFGEVGETVLLFGAGHVGRAVVLALSQLPFSVRWIDSRSDQFPDYVPANVVTVRTDEPEREIDLAPSGAFVLIMTHSHPLDYSIAASALRRADLGFVGLIGSVTKRARFASQARQLGLSEQQIARLVCPIGLPEIKGKQPSIIAASVAAQLLTARERAKPPTPSR